MTPQVTSESSAWRIFLRWYMMLSTKIVPPNKNDLKMHLRHRDRHGRQVENMIRLLGNYLEPRVRHPSGRELRHHCLLRPKCNFIHPKQLSPFPERLKLPFSIDEILSGYEDIVSSGTDQFTTSVKTDPDATLVRHMVDVQKNRCRISRGVVYPCLSSSSDDHPLLHSCLGTGMRVGSQDKFCHFPASLVHSASAIVFISLSVC